MMNKESKRVPMLDEETQILRTISLVMLRRLVRIVDMTAAMPLVQVGCPLDSQVRMFPIHHRKFISQSN